MCQVGLILALVKCFRDICAGWQNLYSDCVSDGWSTDNEDYEDDISGDEPDVPPAPRGRVRYRTESDEGVSDDDDEEEEEQEEEEE